MNKFFQYDQNNSGGSFITNDKVCHRLFIEAPDEEAAERIALSLGVYFNGVERGIDCSCCGDRWSNWSDEIKEYHYEAYNASTIEEYAQAVADRYGWTKPDTRIYYLNGTVKEIFSKKTVM